jgi:hypothetical protein
MKAHPELSQGLACLALVFVAACSGTDEARSVDDVQRCVEDNPASQPFDVGDVIVASPPPGSSAPPPSAPTAESIGAECEMSGGSGCSAGAFISKDAASCIALASDFEVGLEPWSVALTYHYRFARVVWNVMSKLDDRGPGGYSGGILTLDATTGAVLDRGGYDATP